MSAKINNAFELIRLEIANKRPNLQSLDEKLFPLESDLNPKPKSLIEISGNTGSGKTHLLQYLIARLLTPEEFGGKHCRMIYLDLKHKIDATILNQQIETLLLATGTLNAQESKEISLNSLKAVVVENCYTTDEFIQALDDVESILMEDENSEIGLLAIDGLDAFYWQDIQDKRKTMRTHYTQLVERLRSICVANNISCAYTVSSSYLESKGVHHKENAHIDYALMLSYNPTTGRAINNISFSITNKGLLFS